MTTQAESDEKIQEQIAFASCVVPSGDSVASAEKEFEGNWNDKCNCVYVYSQVVN